MILPLHSLPLLKTISTGFIVIFSYNYIKIHLTIFTLLHPLHSPSLFLLVPPPTGPILHSCPSFLKCVLIVQRDFTVVISHMHILGKQELKQILVHPCL
jgi:hypothetical protein